MTMAKKKTETAQKVKCYDCRHAVLYQWDNTPIIAWCNKNKVKDVAMTPRKCGQYHESWKEPEVMKRTHFR